MQLARILYDYFDTHNDIITETILVLKSVLDRLKGSCCLSGDDNDRKIRARK